MVEAILQEEARLRESLWTPSLIDEIVRNKGSIQSIDSLPENIRQVFKTAYVCVAEHLTHIRDATNNPRSDVLIGVLLTPVKIKKP